MKRPISNADEPTFSDVMSDATYLQNTLATRRELTKKADAAKRAAGIRSPKRQADVFEHVGFAEGLLSADEGVKPQLPVAVNPRFRRG